MRGDRKSLKLGKNTAAGSPSVFLRNAQQRFQEAYRLVGGLHSKMFMTVSWQSGRVRHEERSHTLLFVASIGSKTLCSSGSPARSFARIDEGTLTTSDITANQEYESCNINNYFISLFFSLSFFVQMNYFDLVLNVFYWYNFATCIIFYVEFSLYVHRAYCVTQCIMVWLSWNVDNVPMILIDILIGQSTLWAPFARNILLITEHQVLLFLDNWQSASINRRGVDEVTRGLARNSEMRDECSSQNFTKQTLILLYARDKI